MAGGGLSGLVFALTLIAAGPLVAGFLPPGPASLLSPTGAAVAAAAVTVLYALFAWPVLARNRRMRDVLGDGLLLVCVGLPFLIGLGASRGVETRALVSAAVVVMAAIAVTGTWLAGPGCSGRFDRIFAAFWVLVVAVLPLANYVLLDFTGASSTLGFRLSPLLTVRRILAELPGADPVPFLLTGLAFLAVATAGRMVGKATTAVVILLLAGVAGATEVVPVFGDRYVPGRPVALRVRGGPGAVGVTVGVPGRWAWRGSPSPVGEVIHVPGNDGFREVRVGEEAVPLDLRPAPPGKWLVSLGPVPKALSDAADRAGFVIARAEPGTERLPWSDFLSVDGVVDAGGLLSTEEREALRGAGVAVVAGPGDLPPGSPIRRPWTEPGRLLSAEGLQHLFGPDEGPDPGRARTTFLLLFLFATTVLAALRFGRLRGWPALRASLLVLGLSALVTGTILGALPEVEAVEVSRVRAREPGRVVTVYRVRSQRAVTHAFEFDGHPVPLGGGAELELAGNSRMTIALGAHETRYVAVESISRRAIDGPFDFFLTPDGLARPGEAALLPGEFLKRHFTGPDGRTTPNGWLVRKLLRMEGGPGHRFGVRIVEPGLLEVVRLVR